MTLRLNLKALGYGVATFAIGYVLHSLLTTALANAVAWEVGGPLVQIFGYLVPVVAGFISAKQAADRRIVHGAIGGGLGAVFLLVPVAFIPGYPVAGIPFVFASYALLAALGGILGNHYGRKAGP